MKYIGQQGIADPNTALAMQQQKMAAEVRMGSSEELTDVSSAETVTGKRASSSSSSLVIAHITPYVCFLVNFSVNFISIFWSH